MYGFVELVRIQKLGRQSKKVSGQDGTVGLVTKSSWF